MNIEKQLKGGNSYNLSLWINLILIIVYLINEIIIFPITTKNLMTLLGKAPQFLITTKCCYALLMMISILLIHKKPNLCWLSLNLASVGVLSIWYYNYWFYTSIIGEFLLEISAVWLLIITNLKSFVKYYKIKRSFFKAIWIIVIPYIISIIVRILI
jgi:hypothetical protein